MLYSLDTQLIQIRGLQEMERKVVKQQVYSMDLDEWRDMGMDINVLDILMYFDGICKMMNTRSINNNRMNRITDDFKKNLIARYSQRDTDLLPLTSSQPKQIPNSQQRFMQLFQSINRPPQNTSTLSPQKQNDNQAKFASTLAQYSNAPSFIDSVMAISEDALPVGYNSLPLVEAPLLLSHKMPFEEAIRNISLAFEGQDYASHSELVAQQFMDLQAYSTVLSAFGRKSNSQARGLSQVKPLAIREQKMAAVRSLREIQTDTAELQQQVKVQADRMKKIDLLLVELITEKKRKNYLADYQGYMQMKLMQLLDFILQDEPEYANLDPATKTRQVLRNLQSFQGKTIEGESKINLLRIFFQQFTALKKQKEEYNTPIKKVQNRQKTNRTRPQTKKNTTGKVEPPSQENTRSQKKTTKSKTAQGEKRDQWMGSLC